MLECHGMDIIPWSGFIEPGDDTNEDSANPARRLLLESRGGPDWVIFAIDVRNMYGSPFNVTFTRNQPGQ
jgi:trafficking protein particle complex subunit 9